MRYKSAESILIEIAEDKQASGKLRLAACKILVRHLVLGIELPELKGYRSGSRENLLLRFASDPKIPAEDRFKAIKQLLALHHRKDPVEKITVPGPVTNAASEADLIWVEVG